MMQEASKRRCNKIKLLSLSFVSKLISQKILIKLVNCCLKKIIWSSKFNGDYLQLRPGVFPFSGKSRAIDFLCSLSLKCVH